VSPRSNETQDNRLRQAAIAAHHDEELEKAIAGAWADYNPRRHPGRKLVLRPYGKVFSECGVCGEAVL